LNLEPPNRRLGYELEGPYMCKWLTADGAPPPPRAKKGRR
jgi:hypothetical protein